jgi:hypothetical protein
MIASMFDPDFVVPILIFAIPIVAIMGGITAGIVKQLGRQRLIELAQQERIAAIQRGIDPSQLPPLPMDDASGDTVGMSPDRADRQRAQGFLVGGIITLCVGVGLGLMLNFLADREEHVWAVGLVPAFVGIGLLISAAIVWPRGSRR